MDNSRLYYELTAQMAYLEERMEARACDTLDRMLADDRLDEQESARRRQWQSRR